jgi:alpha-methylacyl-CoA racemase
MTAPALAGITVLDLASVGPAARASAMLADYGAHVVKVGPVPKDASRQITPPAYAYSGHRGMHRIQVDLKDPDGRAAFLALAKDADVVLESFRPGVVARLGIGYDDVRAVNPGIIFCSTTGFGQDGPIAQWAGHDVDYQAMAGVLSCAEPAADGKPGLPGATFADSAGGGMHAALAIMAALVRRGATGEGQHLDVSIAEGVLSLMSLAVDEYLATGVVPRPGHNILTGRYACYDTYRCADGDWVAVGAIEPAFYRNLCRLLDCEQWADAQLDDDAQDDIRAAFAAAFASRPRLEWLHALAPNDTCVAPVWTVPELVEDAQFNARGVIHEAEHPTAGRFRQLGPLLAGMDRTPRVHELPDLAVTQTDELLAAAGFNADAIASLRTRGVVA